MQLKLQLEYADYTNFRQSLIVGSEVRAKFEWKFEPNIERINRLKLKSTQNSLNLT